MIALLLAFASPALADEEQAETCVRAKVRESWAEGWSIRTGAKATLSAGEHHVYAVTLQQGNTYRVTGCGDEAVSDLDLVLYDAEANPLVDDTTDDRQPVIEHTAKHTGTYYVVVYVGVAEGAAGVASILTFR